MTQLKTALITSALALIASSAAYADGHGDHDAKTKTMDKATVTTEMKSQGMESALTKANDTAGEILQADGQPDTQSDYELLSYDGTMITKAKARAMESDNYLPNNAIVVPSSTGAVTTVSCPSGTEAQPNMTCLITGETEFRKDTPVYEMTKTEDMQDITQVKAID